MRAEGGTQRDAARSQRKPKATRHWKTLEGSFSRALPTPEFYLRELRNLESRPYPRQAELQSVFQGDSQGILFP